MTTAILQTTYFGPVQWYQKLKRFDHCLIEQYDSYQKQTYRNRCIIATTNGLQALTVPVEHTDEKALVKDLRISDHNQWRRIRLTARVLSLNTMLTISVLSSRSATTSSSISTRPFVRPSAN